MLEHKLIMNKEYLKYHNVTLASHYSTGLYCTELSKQSKVALQYYPKHLAEGCVFNDRSGPFDVYSS